jgi:hypothetical protein
MNKDIRVEVSFRGHRKRKRLKLLLGPESTDFLLDLWISAAMSHPSGILEGMDEIDIALDAGWEGDPKVFVDALVTCGFMEKDDETETYRLHDWEEHQPYVCHAPERSASASNAARVKWEKKRNAESMRSVAHTEGKPSAMRNEEKRNAPSPSPSPSPSPILKNKEKDTPLPPTGGESTSVVSNVITEDVKPPKKSKPDRPRSGAAIEYSQEFERFWQAYPRKVAKDAAFQAWEKTIGGKHGPPPREPTALIDAAVRYAQDCRAKCTEDQYILHASTFLGPKRRWKDFSRPPDWNAPVVGAAGQVASLRDVQGFSPQMTPEGGEIDAKERLRRAQRAEGRC